MKERTFIGLDVHARWVQAGVLDGLLDAVGQAPGVISLQFGDELFQWRVGHRFPR
jgi:hypothetical protein